MNVCYWISSKLRLRGDGSGSSSTGVVIAVSGVALALVVLELTLAIVVGFKDEIRQKLAGFESQITLSGDFDPTSGVQSSFIELTPELSRIARSDIAGSETSLVLRFPGIIKTSDNFEGIVFVGRSPENSFEFEKSNITEGEWPDFRQDSTENHIVVSRPTASALGLGVGDKVFSTFITDGGAVKLRRHKIAGIFESNFGEYDKTVAYASLRGLQKVCGLDSAGGSAIEIRGIPEEIIDQETDRLQAEMMEAYSSGKLSELHPVSNVHFSGAVFYNWLSLLDTNVVVIFILMLCVAGFTLVSSLFILILERVRTIGILRAIGASRSKVRNIFIFMAMRLVGLGLAIGNVVGIGLILIQKYTHVAKLDPAMYYLSHVPVEISPLSVMLLNVGVIAAAWALLVLPAHAASGVDPSKTMRYE